MQHSLSPRLLAQHDLATARDALSRQERLYVQSRLEGSAPAVAARIAGIEDHRCLESAPRIRNALQSAARVARHARRIQREDVVAGFLDAVHMSATATELVNAWREIGRICGLYEPVRIDLNITKQQDFAQMSDAELLELTEGDYQVLDFEEEKHADG